MGEMYWEMGTDGGALPCVKQLVGASCVVPGAQLGAMWVLNQDSLGVRSLAVMMEAMLFPSTVVSLLI